MEAFPKGRLFFIDISVFYVMIILKSLGHLTLRRKKMRESIEKALEKIRPALQADGGDIELIDVVDGVVKVKLTGACGGCPMSQMTLKMGVERVLKQQVPEVKSVETA